jgi:predicted dehydrogenase
MSARAVGDKFRFRFCTTDEPEIFANPDVTTVVITTRHHLHARQVLSALEAGKHVFCEKPLCLNVDELHEIRAAYEQHNTRLLMVGYNRRFAPMARQLKGFFAEVHEPLVMHYRVNAGYIPAEHWVHDPQQGGGRIIGEVCHFVDFLIFLAGAFPLQVHAAALPNNGRYCDDNVVVTLTFANGSVGTVTYVANGDKSVSKERIEVFGAGAAAVLDDFRCLELVRNGSRTVHKARLRQDKGHRGEWEAFIAAMQSGSQAPIPFRDSVVTAQVTFAIIESLRTGRGVEVGE